VSAPTPQPPFVRVATPAAGRQQTFRPRVGAKRDGEDPLKTVDNSSARRVLLSRMQVLTTNRASGLPTLPLTPAIGVLPRDQNPAAVFLARLAPGSRPTMMRSLSLIAAELGGSVDTLPWWSLRYQHTQAIRARLAARFSPATTNKILAALRGVLRESMRLGLVAGDDYARAVDLPCVRGSRLPRGRALSAEEIRTLFSTCDLTTVRGRRDAALIALLYSSGIRRAETVGIDLSDYDEASGTITIRGKGNKQRAIFTTGSAAALDSWLDVRGREPGPLFAPVDKAGRIQRRRLTDHAVLLIVRRLAKRAGLATFSPHDLRRSFISDLLDRGVDIATVASIAGHAQITTTVRYDRRGERARRKASELLHVPFGD
jgi:site-specific recombinase XerD